MKITIENNVILMGITNDMRCQLTDRFTLPNPKYLEAVKFGRWTGRIDRNLTFYQATSDGLILPRGAAREIITSAKEYDQVDIIDNRRSLSELSLSFRGSLRPYQQQATAGILDKEFGVLEAGTGSGKTVMALSIIAARKQPTLILVHTKELLYQWQDRIKTFLDVDAGLIGAGKFEVKPITVGIVNSVHKRLPEVVPYFGHLVVDECHRVPSSLFTGVVTTFDSRFMLGLSATPYRRDGLGVLIGWYLGLHRVTVAAAVLRDSGSVLRPKVINRTTDFLYQYNDDYSTMITALVKDPGRNNLIAADIRAQIGKGGLTLVVSERVEHLEELASLTGAGSCVLTGKTPAKKRVAIIEALSEGSIQTLFSTMSLIGEGFDCPGLDTLFLTTPIKFSGRLKQVVGRILRPAEGKVPLVYDYQDIGVGVLAHQAKSRQKIFATM